MKFHLTNAPSATFMYCLNDNCPRCTTCLRRQGAHEVPAEVQSMKVLNPAAIPADAAQCPFYKARTTIRLAWGFQGLLDSLPVATARQFTDLLLTQWPRSNFYRLRNGERALSPDAQQEVAKALRKVGITQEPVFDRYSEVTDWG